MHRTWGNATAKIFVVEPLGSSGRFLTAAARDLGAVVHAGTHKDIYDSYPAGLRAELAGVCRTDLADPDRALDEMEAYCRAEGVDAVAACWELLTPLATRLAHRLGLPGNDPDRAAASRNKIAMAAALEHAGVSVPRTVVAGTGDEALDLIGAADLAFPLVIKPAEQGGSWGVSVVGGPDEVRAAVDAAQQYTVAAPHGLSLDPRVIVQEYVDGPEYSADTVVQDGRPFPLPVVRKHTTVDAYRIEIGHTCPAPLPHAAAHEIQAVAARAALAVGIRNGVAHTELKVPPGSGRPVVIETGARLPGGNICEVVEHATGISEARAYLRVVLGQAPETTALRDAACAIRFLVPPRAGILRTLRTADLPGVYSEFTVRPGDPLRAPVDNSCRIGHVIATAPNSAQAELLADRAISQTTIEVA
ncbi:ATP-grasp domain-containing protein [Streptomyces sp. So13.3]|uniref:ATP-grasp domain-containing protein n=1 Tax=Streptomyces TaxID=1883 RepID=UPI0011070A4A|nr:MULTISPECIES: ATP-grasp domain-containing protein [Streptomyces]MCZ4097964.1 ATP-grasp domain-containing protein [Streptomyces sp. H39-C1]QNA71706.1 ATP-grasp domain-containing protein [Streptomyces sp. So13.3]